MQQKQELNLEMRKSFASPGVAPTLSLLRRRTGVGGQARGRRLRGLGAAFRDSPREAPGTLVRNFSLWLTSFLSFPHSVFWLVFSISLNLIWLCVF